MFYEETLKKYDYVTRPLGTKSKSMVTNLLEELTAASEEKEKMTEEISSLKKENRRLRRR